MREYSNKPLFYRAAKFNGSMREYVVTEWPSAKDRETPEFIARVWLTRLGLTVEHERTFQNLDEAVAWLREERVKNATEAWESRKERIQRIKHKAELAAKAEVDAQEPETEEPKAVKRTRHTKAKAA